VTHNDHHHQQETETLAYCRCGCPPAVDNKWRAGYLFLKVEIENKDEMVESIKLGIVKEML